MRRFSNERVRYKRLIRVPRRSKKKLKGILKKHKSRRRRRKSKHITFARGTKKAPLKIKEPKLLTSKQKRDRGYSRKLKYCLGILDA